ncbi:MAG: hypothetical protein ACKVP7_19690 [Hyphomicrobiaceae bacterium]
MRKDDQENIGTEDLERGMRAGHARQFAAIAAIAVLLLATVNSGGLARWTQALPSNAMNLRLAELAGDWHALMTRLGPAALYERLRPRKD